MFVRITRGRFDVERADAVDALVPEVARATGAQPGCISWHGGVDRETGTVVAVSTWEDRASAEVALEELSDVIGRVREVISLEPAEVFEVTATA